VIIYANLDQEARWARVTLPQHVLRRISACAALLASFAPEGETAVIHTPVAVDPAIVQAALGRVELRTGVPPHGEVAWADPRAQEANDRRTALALANELGIALPQARAITSLAELDEHLSAGGAAAGFEGRWVCKAPLTAAGRDRAHGTGTTAEGETRVHLGRMLEKFGTLVFEPWLDRLIDLGVCVQLREDGSLHVDRPHTLLADARGNFLGIDIVEPALTEAEHDQLARVIAAAGQRLHSLGHVGAFTVDAFVYREHGHRKLHALCELNARHTFGHVARALHARLGTRMLGFGTPPPGATLLVSSDEVTAFTT
jgi:hypothetical protein